MGMRITMRGPDYRGAVAARKIKAAIDAALEWHRKTNLPKHFKDVARSLYPDAYRANKRSSASVKRAEDYKKQVASMTDSERTEHFRRRRQTQNKQRAGLTAQRIIDRNNELPLVYTGRSRTAILQGHVTFVGPANRRRMKFNPPYYFSIHNRMPGGLLFNKIEALRAIRKTEEDRFADKMDKEIQTYINEKTSVRRSA